MFPRRGGGSANGDPACFQGAAAGRPAFVRRDLRIRQNHTNAIQRHIQLFRRDLRQRRRDTLPQFDFATVDADAAVFVERDPVVDKRIRRQ